MLYPRKPSLASSCGMFRLRKLSTGRAGSHLCSDLGISSSPCSLPLRAPLDRCPSSLDWPDFGQVSDFFSENVDCVAIKLLKSYICEESKKNQFELK
jgi:hypothetical protein